MPPTTLYNPKSTSPNVCNITREVNIPIVIVRSILEHNNMEFFIIRLLFCDVFCSIFDGQIFIVSNTLYVFEVELSSFLLLYFSLNLIKFKTAILE